MKEQTAIEMIDELAAELESRDEGDQALVFRAVADALYGWEPVSEHRVYLDAYNAIKKMYPSQDPFGR